MKPAAASRLATTALDVLRQTIAAVAEGHPADNTLARLFRDHREWGSRDRRFISAVVFSYFRWRGWLDGLELPLAAGLAYSLDATEPNDAHAALNGQELPLWGQLNVGEKMVDVDRFTHQPHAVTMLVPEWLPWMFKYDDTLRLISSFQQRPPTWIRAMRGHEEKVFAALTETGVPVRRDERIASASACDGNVNLIEVRRGIGNIFEVQDIASQAVGLLCEPKPGQRWLDLCAGAGGKTLHLADLMGDEGEVIATDLRDSALDELEERTKRAGLKSIRAIRPGGEINGLFDGVLVDAPCSGIGTWSRNPDMRWRTDKTVVADKAKLQGELLLRAADFVKPLGDLVYAVCTITPDETTEVVKTFLAARTDFAALDIASPLTPAAKPAASVRMMPDDGPGDGMFVARLRRK